MNLQLLVCSCGAPRAQGAITCDGCRTDLAGAASDTGKTYAIGTVLGSYRLLHQIGVGGMGRVFVAEHIRLGRRVALKVLRSEFSGNLEAVKRFFAEARSVNCISHENIIEVSDFVENPSGASFYIMELLQGLDLRATQERDGILPLSRTLPIALQVCSALAAVHDAGIIHRDLKPDNIFLIERGGHPDFVKLLDFGVAKLMHGTVDDASAARSSVGMVVGTPNYMAPEQALGHSASHLVDVYSMGVILFEMVAGRRPFVGKTAREVIVQHVMTPAPRPRDLNPAGDIPDALEELILACLCKEPNDRPTSIKEVEQRLGAIRDALPTTRKRGSLSGSRRGLRGRRGLVYLVCGLALSLTVVATVARVRGATLSFRGTRWMAEINSVLKARNPASAGERRRRQSPLRSVFTVEPAAEAAVAPIPPGPPTGASSASSAQKVVKAPNPPTRTVSKKSAPASKTLPLPTNERRQMDRDAVLNPFE